ncbi:MAG: preprotein translocase subunit SecE [Candidatus Spyradenecus sp.]
MIKKVGQFLSDVILEGKRVTWPARRELVDSSVVVLLFIVILAVVIMCCDEAIRKVLAWILG